MEPIVSPWLVWLLSFIDKAIVLFAFAGALVNVAGVTALVALLWDRMEYTQYDNEWATEGLAQNNRHLSFCGRLLCLVGLPLLLTAILLPSKNTLISMAMASYVTTNKAELVLGDGKDALLDLRQHLLETIPDGDKARGKNQK